MPRKTILVKCGSCKSSGWQDCPDCQGEGGRLRSSHTARGPYQVTWGCKTCLDMGQLPCPSCGGKGTKHKDVVDWRSTLSSTRRRVGRLKSMIHRSMKFNAFAPPNTAPSQKNPLSSVTRIEVHHKVPPSSVQIELIGCVIALALALLLLVVLLFGLDRVLVAGEAFFLFSAWAGLRAAGLFGSQSGPRLESFRQYMAIGFGLCCGFLAAYLILTTPEGRAITEWVTARTLRIIGSLLAMALGLGVLEMVWRRAVA